MRVKKIVNASPSRNVLISPLEDPLNAIPTFNEAVTVTEICNNKRVVLAVRDIFRSFSMHQKSDFHH